MPSNPDIPVGTVRNHAPVMRDQDSLSMPAAASGMQPGFPIAEYIVLDSPPVIPVTRGARTLLTLGTGTATSGRAFSEFATPRLDAANSRIKPTSASEILHIRFSCKIVKDPNASLSVTTLLNTLITTVTGVTGVDQAFATPQFAIVEADGGSSFGSFFQTTAPLVALPQVIGMEFVASGATAFLTNGAKFYLTLSVAGLAVTDVRMLLVQAR